MYVIIPNYVNQPFEAPPMKIHHNAFCLLLITILNGCNSGAQIPAATTAISCVETGVESIQQCSVSSSGITTAYGFNNMPYALCSETSCMVSSSSANVATCVCPIIYQSGWQSASLSPTEYASAQPTWNLDGSLQTVQSNYSLANTPPQPQQCTFETMQQWASCFGVRCSVLDNGTANCKCPIKSSYTFIFELPASSCSSFSERIWSAAPVNGSGYNEMLLIYQTLYPTAPVL